MRRSIDRHFRRRAPAADTFKPIGEAAAAVTYFTRAHIGDRVFDKADPRHIGRIERIVWSTTARVRWLDTGWISEVPLSELRRAP